MNNAVGQDFNEMSAGYTMAMLQTAGEPKPASTAEVAAADFVQADILFGGFLGGAGLGAAATVGQSTGFSMASLAHYADTAASIADEGRGTNLPKPQAETFTAENNTVFSAAALSGQKHGFEARPSGPLPSHTEGMSAFSMKIQAPNSRLDMSMKPGELAQRTGMSGPAGFKRRVA